MIVHVVEAFEGGVFESIRMLVNSVKFKKHLIIYSIRPKTPKSFSCYFSDSTQFIEWKYVDGEISLKFDFLALIELRRTLLDENICSNVSAIHFHSSKAGFLGRLALLSLFGRAPSQLNSIYTTHGIAFLRQDVSGTTRALFVLVEKVLSFTKTKIVTCSKSESIACAEYGIDNLTINNAPPKVIGLRKNKERSQINVVSVGRLAPQKNPKEFFEIASLLSEFPNIRFVWVGGDRDFFESELPENVVITGWVENRRVSDYLLDSDIYLSTSKWEGLPLAVLEGMSAGLPLVLSECTGHGDLIDKNGVLYSTVDDAVSAILSLVEDFENRQVMGLASFEMVTEGAFSKEQYVKAHKNLYFKANKSGNYK